MKNLKSLCDLIMPEKMISDVLKMNYLGYEDLKVCNYVIMNCLPLKQIQI